MNSHEAAAAAALLTSGKDFCFQAYRDQPASNVLVENHLAPDQYIKAAEPEWLFLRKTAKPWHKVCFAGPR